MDNNKNPTLLSLPIDILLIFFKYLTNREILRMFLVCKYFYDMRMHIHYFSEVALFDIKNLSYFDKFTRVKADGFILEKFVGDKIKNKPTKILPLNTRHLTLSKINVPALSPFIFFGLKFITHLIIKNDLKIEINRDFFPKTLTHLSWHVSFNRVLKDVLPLTLISLKLVYYTPWNFPLPTTLKYLDLVCHTPAHHLLKKNILPNGLLTLKLQGHVYYDDDAIPPSVKKIIFSKNRNLKVYIPLTVEECVVHRQKDVQFIARHHPHLRTIKSITKTKKKNNK